VEVFDGFGNLYNYMLAEVLAEISQSHDLRKQFSSSAQFENDVAKLLAFDEVDQLHYVGMVDVAHYLDLVKNLGALKQLDG
jgi:hypothetical protein